MATSRVEIVIATRGGRNAERDIRRVGSAATATSKALGLLRAALVVVASARVLGQVTDLVDAYTNLQNRLRLVTRDTQELTQVQDALFRVSQETRTSVEGNAEVFNRLARSTASLGLTFQELLDITKGLGQAVQIAGATSQEARNALIQFSQGLAAGAIQGEELRAVVEQLPPLADALGREFGISGAQLIAFNKSNPGFLKTEAGIRGVQSALAKFNEQFKEITPTIEGAFVQLRNSIVAFIGQANEATGASAVLATAIKFIADNLSTIASVLLTVGAAFAATFAGGALVRGVGALLTSLRSVSGVLGLISGVGKLAITGLVVSFGLLRNELVVVNGGISTLGDLVTSVFGAAFTAIQRVVVALVNELNPGFADGKSLAEAFAQVLADGFIAVARAVIRTTAAVAGLIRLFRNLGLVGTITRALSITIGRNLVNAFIRARNAASDFVKTATRGVVDFGTIAEQGFTPSEEKLRAAGANAAKVLGNSFANALGQDLADQGIDELNKAVTAGQVRTAGRVDVGGAGDNLLGRTPDVEKGTKALEGLSKAAIAARKALDGLLASVSPFIAAQLKLAESQRIVNEAEKNGIVSRLTLEEIQKRQLRELTGVGNAATDLAEKQEVLNLAFRKGAISAEELNVQLRKNRIEFLETQTTASAGTERFFLKFVEQAEDAATQTEELLSTAFKGAEDAIVKFVQTGKLEFNDLFQSLSEQLIRLGTQQAIAGLLGGQQSGGGGGIGGLIGSLFSGGSGGGGGGIGGLVGSLFSGGFGFQNGGSFIVGPSAGVGATLPGADNRLVPLRLQDGERVDVTPKGGQAAAPNIVFNITTPDAESFRRSEGQIFARAQSGISRQGRRNN